MMTQKIRFFYIGIILLATLLTLFSPNKNTAKDSDATLLVSESIWKNGSIKLDYYSDKILQSYTYAIQQKNGHAYYYFPMGTSVLSVPFVMLANTFGIDMADSGRKMQRVIASVITIFILIFLIKLANFFLTPLNAILIASVFWFGTSWASTTATALWSHNFASLFGLLAIYYAIKSIKEKQYKHGLAIGCFLFLAYFCRPTMALLSPCTLIFLFTYNRIMAIKAAVVLTTLLMAFVAYSFYEFQQFLPDYYLPKRLESNSFFEALYGNLFSPARGILIYSPFILLAWLCFKDATINFNLKISWLLVGLIWPALHLIAISKFPHWWGGHSYGARLMTDVLPGLFLLTLRSWPIFLKNAKNKFGIALLIISSVFAIYLNTWQGLFNKYILIWNGEPNIDAYPGYLFDWKYPQFLHNKEKHEARIKEHEQHEKSII